MNDFDSLLKKALSKKEPPLGFLSRFQKRMPKHRWNPSNWLEGVRKLLLFPKMRWAAGGLATILLLAVGYFQFQSQRRARWEGERAKEQLVLALRVTNERLGFVQKKLSKLENKELYIKVE